MMDLLHPHDIYVLPREAVIVTEDMVDSLVNSKHTRKHA